MPTCDNCGTEYADNLEHCPVCAGGSDEEFVCDECEQVYRDSDSCPACGTMRVPATCDVHPDRGADARCVVCARALCEECRTGDAAALCPDHRTVQVIEGWAQIYSESNPLEAQLLTENLRAEGIDAQIYSQKDRTFTVALGELSIVRVLVPVWEYESALRVLRSHMDAEGEVSFACPECGEAYEDGATECATCGAALV